jgi:hypothetical protein
MRPDAPALARNMSAPPRTTLSYAALAPSSGATGDAIADGAGLRFVCRLDLRALLPESYRQPTRGQFQDPEPAQVHGRLRLALVYAQAEALGKRRALSGSHARARATAIEAVADELRDLVVREPLADARLPRFGLFLQADYDERATLPSLRRTLAILARRRGGVFLRDADPIVWSAVDGEALDLWTPAPATGSAA